MIYHFMVVVIGGADGTYAYHSVCSSFILFETQLLPQRVIGINKEYGCVVGSFRSESRFDNK